LHGYSIGVMPCTTTANVRISHELLWTERMLGLGFKFSRK